MGTPATITPIPLTTPRILGRHITITPTTRTTITHTPPTPTQQCMHTITCTPPTVERAHERIITTITTTAAQTITAAASLFLLFTPTNTNINPPNDLFLYTMCSSRHAGIPPRLII